VAASVTALFVPQFGGRVIGNERPSKDDDRCQLPVWRWSVWATGNDQLFSRASASRAVRAISAARSDYRQVNQVEE
jgi:hypothetical protein